MKTGKRWLVILFAVVILGIIATILAYPYIQKYLDRAEEKRIAQLENITPVGSYSPEEVLEKSKELNGKEIEVKGVIQMASFGLGKMGPPTMGPAFVTQKGTIVLSGNREVYDALAAHKTTIIRGVYKIKSDSNYYQGFYQGFLGVPLKCKQCVVVLE